MNPYELFDLPRAATAEAVKARYRKLAFENHPDRGGSAEAFKRITDAYELLAAPEARAATDARLVAEDATRQFQTLIELIKKRDEKRAASARQVVPPSPLVFTEMFQEAAQGHAGVTPHLMTLGGLTLDIFTAAHRPVPPPPLRKKRRGRARGTR